MKKKKKVEHDSFENEDLSSYLKLIEETTHRLKQKTIKDIDLFGDKLISEMVTRREREEKRKDELINSILQKTKKDKLNFDELKELPYEDIVDLHKKTSEKGSIKFLKKISKLFDNNKK